MKDNQLEAIVAAVIRELKGPPAAGASTRAGAGPEGFTPGPRRAGNLDIAVLGAGHGGLAMAGHLSLMGNKVRLFSFFARELDPVAAQGGIEVTGKEVSGFARLSEVTRCIDQAVKGAQLVMIASPAFTHANYAALLAGLLEDGQIVVLNPGRTGGALEFAQVLRRYAMRARIYLAEAQTFIYAAEMRGPGKVEILKEKFKMRVAALPARDNGQVIPVLQQLYPQIEAAQNVLETSVNNVGAVNHPTATLLNTPLIERAAKGEDHRFYRDLITPTICQLVMEKIDHERCQLGQALGLDTWTAMDWYHNCYRVTGSTLFEVYQNNHYYLGFHAPTHILGQNNLLDEIPNSLVPMSVLSRQLGLCTPAIDAIVELGSVMTGIEMWKAGRTAEKMGVAGLSRDQLLEYVEDRHFLGPCGESGVCRVMPQFS